MNEVIVCVVKLTNRLAPDSRGWRLVAMMAALVASLSIIATYRVFNNMYDEPAHLAAGMEWLSRGTYTLEPQHPPLSRIAAAILPWMAGSRSMGNAHMYTEGRLILGRGDQYERTLALARLGQLPFFFLLAFATWYWARRVADERTGALAVCFIAANPNILAHAGVAGTDIGPAALMPTALIVWVLWLERPSWRRSVLLGIAVALCGLTKFSALAFWLPAAIGVAMLARPRPLHVGSPTSAREWARPATLAVGSAALVTWMAYRFSIGDVGTLTLPAPAFWTGLRDFFRHGTGGHPAFLFGEVRLGGWWYYDIVAFLVKTPVAPLLFAAAGVRLALRRANATATEAGHPLEARALPIAIASVLIVSSLTPVDIGVRLLLPAYAPLAVLAAVGLVWAWTNARQLGHRLVVAALCLWTLIDPVAAHPDHLAYFNVLAGPRPERVLVDSNLDWGQDLYRLRDASRALRMDSLRVHYFGTAEMAAVGLERARRLRPNERTTGWIAASETFYAGVWADTALHWLRRHEPVARVGRSIRLYHIPADSSSTR